MAQVPTKLFRHEVDEDFLKKQVLYVAVPMYGGQCYGSFAKSMQDLVTLCKEEDIQLKIYYLFNESLITRARNYCVDEFMRSGDHDGVWATHMMFIDSDISFNPRDVLGMLSMMTPDSPYDVLCGPYPKKCISWEKIKTAVDKGVANKDPNLLERFVGDFVFNPKGSGVFKVTEPQEVLEGGTGFMMIKKKVFEDFKEHFPHHAYRPDHIRAAAFDGSRQIMMYFQAEIDQLDWQVEYKAALASMHGGLDENASYSGKQIRDQLVSLVKELAEKNAKKSNRYLSEDYWFCQRIQEFGARVWLLPWIRLQHTGTYIFSGNLMDMANIGVSATADPKALKKAS